MAAKPMTVGLLLRAATAWLQGNKYDEPRITAELLLASALSVNRAGLYARLTDPIGPEARAEFEAMLTRRANGEPVAYILGEREFYGLPLIVRPGVLIPRPETELLVEQVLDFARRHPGKAACIADVGTGSGAVAVAVAVHLPLARVVAIDLSPNALAVAQENVERHGVADRVDLRVANLLDGVDGPFDVIAGNLPYVPTKTVETLDRSVREWEPRLALDGGPQGLTPHERLLTQLPGRLRPRSAGYSPLSRGFR
jgi:release factor glutamine methyltransferase